MPHSASHLQRLLKKIEKGQERIVALEEEVDNVELEIRKVDAVIAATMEEVTAREALLARAEARLVNSDKSSLIAML